MLMNTKALQRAQTGLSLLDIQQFKFEGRVVEGYEPRISLDEQSISFQSKKTMDSASIIELHNGDEEHSYLFRVEIGMGVRYVDKSECHSEDDEPFVLAQIEASYRVDYVIDDHKLIDDQEALDEFSTLNTPHHIWAFWREYVDSQTGRMRLPKAMMPLLPRIND